jgi:hypothetical protein
MNLKTAVLEVECPACGAQPKEPCLKINGTPMAEPHSKRKALALALRTPKPQDDANQSGSPEIKAH